MARMMRCDRCAVNIEKEADFCHVKFNHRSTPDITMPFEVCSDCYAMVMREIEQYKFLPKAAVNG